jgi:tripartite-type tricarboxylate transporter receptor subunit TctC
MKLPRRKFLRLTAGAAAVPAASRIATAQTYPSRSVRIIVGLPAGSTSDIIARLMGQWLSERLGQPFVIENRPGAGTNIGTEIVAKSLPDGYTLLFVLAANAINVAFYHNPNFDFIRDIVPVAKITATAFVMEVNPSFPAKTVPEFIAYAKANPGEIGMSSPGNGTGSHVFGELFKMMAGVDMVHVPYRGDYTSDLLAGRVQVAFNPISSTIELIRAGKLRALAVTTATRQERLPEIPTLGEFLPGYEASGWQGIGSPKDTPSEIIGKLNTAINAGLADPQIKARFADLGVLPTPMTPAEFGTLIANETEKWAKVIKFAGIKPE